MLENFHLVRPLWLLALIPLSLLLWYVYRTDSGDSPWRRIVDARLLPLLMIGRANTANQVALWLLASGWIITVLALSSPTWERKPQPVYQTTAARVIVLDLSSSMDSTDLKPSRLVRARFKVEDVLAVGTEGQTGLVVYAGDAFTVSPLTRDVNTVRALLKVLEPEIMPIDGSRADLGLFKAGDLLSQAGASDGQVLLFTDGVDADNVAASEAAAAQLRKDGYTVSVLGVGNGDSMPLTDAEGRLVRDAAGMIVESRLDSATLESVAGAGGGVYRAITGDGEALQALLREPRSGRAQAGTRTDATAQGWKEQGPLLVILLLPLAALAFRRNWLVCVLLVAGLASPPQTAMAANWKLPTWNDLWARSDQQAARAFEAGDFAKAAELASDANLRGSAEYKRGNYQGALDGFAQATGADADYNRGNALARLGRYQDAIAAYDKSLSENPGDEDALANKAAVQALLQQQQAQQQSSNSQGDSSQQDQSQSNGDGQNSSQRNAQDRSSRDGKQAQADSASDQEQVPMDSTQADDASPDGKASSEHGQNMPEKNAESGKESEPHPPAAPDEAQQNKPDNQFAEAAKKLAEEEQRADANAGADQQSDEAIAGNAPHQAQANPTPDAQVGSAGHAQRLDNEEQMAADQWLRRIPDDPGGLLRRKFLYQYQQRAQQR
jgi:Ca-activated chloride channel family protein